MCFCRDGYVGVFVLSCQPCLSVYFVCQWNPYILPISRKQLSWHVYTCMLQPTCTYLSLPPDSIPYCSKLLPVLIIRKLFQLLVLLYHTLRHRYWEWRTSTQGTVHEVSLNHKMKIQNGGSSRGGGTRGAGKRTGKSRKLQRNDPHPTLSKAEEEQEMTDTSGSHDLLKEEERANPTDSNQTGALLQSTYTPQEVAPTKAPSHSQPTTTSEGDDGAASAGGKSPATHLSQGDGGKLVIEDSSSWSQYQQKKLEWALSNYSQQSSEQRWSLVAEAVPGKTKVDLQTPHLNTCSVSVEINWHSHIRLV